MKKLSILVVHPEHEPAQRIADALRAGGHEVVVVPDGERAIDRFIQRPSNVLIVEMLLPGRDGATTVESIRWAPKGSEAALFLLGSRRTDRILLDAVGERLGARKALAGPIDVASIASAVAEFAEAGAPSPNAVITSDAATPSEAWTEATTRPGAQRPPPALLSAPSPSPGEHTLPNIDEEMTGDWGPGDHPKAEQEGADVERHARASVQGGSPADAGDFSTTPFPRLLYLIATSRKNGALVLTSVGDRRRTTTGESPKKVVFFRSGVPRYVQSNLVQECLGQVLARGGRISHATLEESVGRMRRGEGRQGAVLLSIGAITPHQLRDALEDQLRIKLFDLFAWTVGSYAFQAETPPPPESVTLEMSLPEMVFKGVVHRIPPQQLLERLSPNLESYVVPEPRQLSHFDRVELAPEAERVLHGLDGTTRLREILARAGERPGTAAQLIYALHCANAVHFSAEPHHTELLSTEDADDASPVTMELVALREELGRLCRLLRAERYQEALGAVPGDRAGAIARADELRARFQPVTEPDAAPRDLRALAFEVSARLVHAREALGAAPGEQRTPLELAQAFDGGMSTRPQKIQKQGGPPQVEPALADEVHSATPPPSDHAHEEDDEEEGGGRPTLPAPMPDPELGRPTLADGPHSSDAEPSPQSPEAGSTDFAAPIATVTSTSVATNTPVPAPHLGKPAPPQFVEPPRRRFEVSRIIDTDNLPPPKAPKQEGPSLDEQVDRLYQAERHFRRGERALGRGKAEDAARAFTRAAELCPEEGEFISHAGYARYQATKEVVVVKRALDELERGTQLSPKLDITHLLLARVLADRQQNTAAREAYASALEANPDCSEALEGLRALD